MFCNFLFCMALVFQALVVVFCDVTDQVTCTTSAGELSIDVHSAWSALDASNFLSLTRAKFYENSPFIFSRKQSIGFFGENLGLPDFDSSAKHLENNYVFFPTTSDTSIVFAPTDLHNLNPSMYHPAFGVVKLNTDFLKDVHGVVHDCTIAAEHKASHRTTKSMTNNFERFNVGDDDSLLEGDGVEINFEANELKPRIFNRPLNVGKAKGSKSSRLTDDFGFPVRTSPNTEEKPAPVEDQKLSTEAMLYSGVAVTVIISVGYYWYKHLASKQQPLLGKFV